MLNMTNTAIEWVSRYGEGAILVLTFLESSAFTGLIVPGEMAAVSGGVFASQDILNLHLTVVVSLSGAILGDSFGYFLGRRIGKPVIIKYGKYFLFNEKYYHIVRAFFSNHGGKTIFFGRFASVLRSFAPFVAGIAHMRHKTFLIYNIAGGVCWASIYVFLGYFAGREWKVVHSYLGKGAVIAFIVGVILVYCYFKKKGEILWKRC